MFFIRPRSQQARRQRDTLMEISAGDEVLTGAGIFGTVLDVESDRVTLETAPGTRITVLRSTIARRIDPVAETPSWDEHDEDEAHGAYHDYEHSHTDDDEHDEGEEHDAHDSHGADDTDANETDAHDADADADADAHDADADADVDDTVASAEHVDLEGGADGPDDTSADGVGDKKKR